PRRQRVRTGADPSACRLRSSSDLLVRLWLDRDPRPTQPLWQPVASLRKRFGNRLRALTFHWYTEGGGYAGPVSPRSTPVTGGGASGGQDDGRRGRGRRLGHNRVACPEQHPAGERGTSAAGARRRGGVRLHDQQRGPRAGDAEHHADRRRDVVPVQPFL